MEHHQILPRLGYNSRMADDDDFEFNTENPDDEYAGLMTQREKDWIIKIQLMQLHTDNPYVDDFYYTVGFDILRIYELSIYFISK